MTIGKRLAALEQRRRSHRLVDIPMITAAAGETSDDAIARYVTEHGPLPEVDEGQINVIVMTLVQPDPRVEA
jgi:hypothetical protein